jgi:Zn finger protein HypA/HybF involved in hydrogenase expression
MIKNSKTVLKCNNCDPSYKLAEMNPRSIIRGKRAEYCKNFIGTHIGLDAPDDYNKKLDQLICPFCNNKLIDTGFPVEDFHLIGKATDWNRQVLDLMMELHDKDLIEYQLKLNQFKLQQEQHEAIIEHERESNRPHCPTCGSTNIKKITGTERATSVIGLGIFSNKINKSYKCLKCKSTW